MSSIIDWMTRRAGGGRYRERCLAWKRGPNQRPRILGHRGARHAHPENALLAFEEALREGADGVELDVRATGDGLLVVFHDPRLPRELTGGAADVSGAGPALSELSASQLAQVRLPRGQTIPTLAEVLAWQRDTGAWLNVELKGDVPAPSHVVRAACALLNEHGGDRVLISSFYPRMLVECALRAPDIPRAWLVHAEQRLLKNAPAWSWTTAAGVHPQVEGLSATQVQRLLAEGALVNVWTVNDAADAVRLGGLGVDGLISDVPGLVREALETGAAPGVIPPGAQQRKRSQDPRSAGVLVR